MGARPASRALLIAGLLLAPTGCDRSPASTASSPERTSGDAALPGDADAAHAADACRDLACLARARLEYQPDREWRRSAVSPSVPSDELAESDYRPLPDAPAVAVQFSQDAMRVELAAETAGGEPVTGTRLAEHTDRAFYELDLFAGGRFVVQARAGELHTEYTVYGSGVPIVSSTRGRLLERK